MFRTEESIATIAVNIIPYFWENYIDDDWCYYDDTTANRTSFNFQYFPE